MQCQEPRYKEREPYIKQLMDWERIDFCEKVNEHLLYQIILFSFFSKFSSVQQPGVEKLTLIVIIDSKLAEI